MVSTASESTGLRQVAIKADWIESLRQKTGAWPEEAREDSVCRDRQVLARRGLKAWQVYCGVDWTHQVESLSPKPLRNTQCSRAARRLFSCAV